MSPSPAKKRAPFIVIEGLDRSGKTTQTSKLHSRLTENGVDATLVKFPGTSSPIFHGLSFTTFMFYIDRTTAIGKMIDSYLRSTSELDDHAIHLLFSANRWELACVSPTSQHMIDA
jgi:dTMP kinase